MGLSKIIGVASTDNIIIGDWVRTETNSDIGTVAGIGTTNITLDAVNSIDVPRKISFARVESQYYAQDRPELGFAVAAGATSVVGGNPVSFTISATNIQSDQEVRWVAEEQDGETEGYITVVPNLNNCTGVSTVSFTPKTVFEDSVLTFEMHCSPIDITTTVGVTTA